MNEKYLKNRRVYNFVQSFLRLVTVSFFAYQLLGKILLTSGFSTSILIQIVILSLYVFGMALLPVNRISMYIESAAIIGIMFFLKENIFISLFVFPISISIASQLKKIDMVIVPIIVLAAVFLGYGWNVVTIGFALSLFSFFIIKERETGTKNDEVKKLRIYAAEKDLTIRELEADILTREKENEALMEIFIRTKSLNEKMDIEELIEELISAPETFFKAEFVALYVFDEDRYRLLKQSTEKTRYDISKTVSAKEGEVPIISPKQLRVPIKLDKKSWGILDIYGRREEIENGQKILVNFNDDDYATMATYAGQVMFSIKHVKMRIQMEEMAKTDALTKLANRRCFEQQFEYLIKQARRGYELALISLDIDYFKKFNDTYGHAKGDEALIIVSEVLQAYVREMDFVGRLGGEEFSILVPNANDKAVEIAERLRKKVSIVPFVRPITISLGIAYYGKDGKSMDELMKNADKALYVAKERGRNQVVEYWTTVEKSENGEPALSETREKQE